MHRLHHFGHNQNFPQKIDSDNFICLMNSNFMQKSGKRNEPILRKCRYGRTDERRGLNSQDTSVGTQKR